MASPHSSYAKGGSENHPQQQGLQISFTTTRPHKQLLEAASRGFGDEAALLALLLLLHCAALWHTAVFCCIACFKPFKFSVCKPWEVAPSHKGLSQLQTAWAHDECLAQYCRLYKRLPLPCLWSAALDKSFIHTAPPLRVAPTHAKIHRLPTNARPAFESCKLQL